VGKVKLLDSDFLIEILKNNKDALRKFSELVNGGEELVTSVINAQEILYVPVKNEKLEEYEAADHLLKSFRILNYEYESMIWAVRIKSKLEAAGKSIGNFDPMVAGTCLNYSATIVTRSVDHFSRIPNLRVERW
jgi:tRNA(fMet)-specific endonuclease VapC